MTKKQQALKFIKGKVVKGLEVSKQAIEQSDKDVWHKNIGLSHHGIEFLVKLGHPVKGLKKQYTEILNKGRDYFNSDQYKILIKEREERSKYPSWYHPDCVCHRDPMADEECPAHGLSRR